MLNLEEKVAIDWPTHLWSDVSVLLAVSGGADSMALLRAMVQLRAESESDQGAQGKLIAVHFNHQLRAEESQKDEHLVVETCQKLGIDLICGRGDVEAAAGLEGDGIEAAARAARYAFFIEAAQQRGARYIATAHTADDQAETILHRILRGTAIRGLRGIPRLRQLNDAVTLIRPMLQINREEVERYLTELEHPYRDDGSNRDVKFTRNRIRHELLPQLAEQYNPNVRNALIQLGQLATESQHFVQQQVQAIEDSAAVLILPDLLKLDCEQLSNQSAYILRELLVRVWSKQGWPEQSMGFTQWNSLVSMLNPNTESPPIQTLPGNVRAEKKGGILKLSRL